MKHPNLDSLEGNVDSYDADDLLEQEAREVAQAIGDTFDRTFEEDEDV